MRAISGTKGSSGFGSVSNEQIESTTAGVSCRAPDEVRERGPRTGESTREWARAHGAGHGRRRTFRDGQRRRPLSVQDVQADRSIAVHVRMVYAGGEGDLRRLEGVVRGEVDVQEEHAALEGRVARAHDCRLQGCDREGVGTCRECRERVCEEKGSRHCGAAVARGRLVGPASGTSPRPRGLHCTKREGPCRCPATPSGSSWTP